MGIRVWLQFTAFRPISLADLNRSESSTESLISLKLKSKIPDYKSFCRGRFMVKKKQKKLDGYSVLIAKVFPPDDRVAVDVLRLCLYAMTFTLLRSGVNGHKTIPKDCHALTVASGRNALQVRLMYSFLYEGIRVVNEIAKEPEFLKLRPTLDNDAETAFTQLLSVKLNDQWKNRDWGLSEAISRARNTATFHYDRERIKGGTTTLA